MALESVDFYITDTTLQANPVSGVTVKVTSQNGSLLFSQVATDAAGHVGFLLPSDQTYQARFFKFGVGFTNPQFFTVLPLPLQPGQTNSFNIDAALLTPPVPLDARLCTAFGFFRDVTGAAQASVEVHFIAKFDPVWLDGSAVLKERVIIRSDESGYAQVNLIRNGQYDVTVQGEEDIIRKISVPDAHNVNLADLLFPVVSQVLLTPPGPYTVKAGQSSVLGFKVLASDGEDLGIGIGDILISTTDQNILSFSLTNDGLTLIGVGPGTAQIVVARADQSIVRIPDNGVIGSPISVTVTL